MPTYGSLRLGIEVLGFFEERHERNLGSHADQQEEKQLGHQAETDYREIQWSTPLSLSDELTKRCVEELLLGPRPLPWRATF